MTLNQLTYFYHAATLQHFNQAAEKANISEPSLSRSIAALEAEFNVILFEKKGRNVQLTKAGNVLLKHATYILNEVQATENKIIRLPPTADILTLPTSLRLPGIMFHGLSARSCPSPRIKTLFLIFIRISLPKMWRD